MTETNIQCCSKCLRKVGGTIATFYCFNSSCHCHTAPLASQEKEGWEAEFGKRFIGFLAHEGNYTYIKSFITSLIQKVKEDEAKRYGLTTTYERAEASVHRELGFEAGRREATEELKRRILELKGHNNCVNHAFTNIECVSCMINVAINETCDSLLARLNEKEV